MLSTSVNLNQPQYQKVHGNSAQESSYQQRLHAEIEQALKASQAQAMNSGIAPIYEPGKEPRKWQPKLEDYSSTISSYTKPYKVLKGKGRRHEMIDSTAYPNYLQSENADGAKPLAKLNQHMAVTKHPATLKTPQAQKLATGTNTSVAKLKREAKAEHYRSIGKGPDLSKTRRVELKNTKTYNRLAGCDLTLYHSGRNTKRNIPSKLASGINLRIAVSQDNLKILAVLHVEDPLTGAAGFYNLASLNWHISSLPGSFVRCFIDKMEDRHMAKTGHWQYKPTYFFEVKNQGQLEHGFISRNNTAPVNQAQVEQGQRFLTNIRDLILQSLYEQKKNGVSSPAAWLAVHSLSPQTDGDDALTQISAQGSRFQFTSWDAVPEMLLQDKLIRSLKTLEEAATGKPVSMISPDTMQIYHEVLQNAKADGTIGIPLQSSRLKGSQAASPNIVSDILETVIPGRLDEGTNVPSSGFIDSMDTDDLGSNENCVADISDIPSTVEHTISESMLNEHEHILMLKPESALRYRFDLKKSVEIAMDLVDNTPPPTEPMDNSILGQSLLPVPAKSMSVSQPSKVKEDTDRNLSVMKPNEPSKAGTLKAGQGLDGGVPIPVSNKTTHKNSGLDVGRDEFIEEVEESDGQFKHFKMDEITTRRLLEARQAQRREMRLRKMKYYRQNSVASSNTASSSVPRSNVSEFEGVPVDLMEYERKYRLYFPEKRKEEEDLLINRDLSEGGVAIPSVVDYFNADIERAIELASVSQYVDNSDGSDTRSHAGRVTSLFSDAHKLKKIFNVRNYKNKAKEKEKSMEYGM
ncbi:hypothetical protein ABW20_dc0110449 [Dactylellina cionopaga]|nr:hypothetical protein ABW20_dc0110449 [Dactylellina cionopaga]